MAVPSGVSIDIRLDKCLRRVPSLYKVIKYNRPVLSSYYPGETVSGHIVLTRKNSQTNILSANLLLSFQGKADVHIVTNKHFLFIPHGNVFRDSGEAINYEGYTAIEPYFDEKRVVIANNIKIPMGENLYNFSFKLPETNCPPSFCGKHGDIIYGMEARLECLGFEDMFTVVAFNVMGLLHLQDIPDANAPLFVTGEIRPILQCCWGRELYIKIGLPRAGYLPNDLIKPTIEIHNHTHKYIKRIFARLQRKAQYFVGSVMKEETKVLEETILPGFGSQCMECRRQTVFKMPECQPSLEWGIIRITYSVALIFDIRRSRNLRIDLPIIVGTTRD